MSFKLFYLFFYIAIASFTYINIHLLNLGWDVGYIGVINSVARTIALISFPVWGILSDLFRANKKMLMATLTIAAFSAALFLIPGNKIYYSIIFVLFIVFLLSSPQLGDAMTLGALKKQSDYGRYRLWGSIGFTVFISIIGFVVEKFNSKYLFAFAIISLLFSVFFVSKFPDTDSKLEFPKLSDFRMLVKNKELRFYLLFVFLIFTTFDIYMMFFPIYVVDNNYGESLIGIAYMIAAASEIMIFYYFANIKKKFGIRTLLIVVSFGFALRWLLIGLFPNPAVILGTQFLHSITFGLFHASSVYYVNQLCGLTFKATGQNLYAVFKSLSGISGALIGGYIYNQFGGSVMFCFTAGLAAIAGILYIFRENIIDEAEG